MTFDAVIFCSERLYNGLSDKKDNFIFIDPILVKSEIKSKIIKFKKENINKILIIDECSVIDKSSEADIFIVKDHINMSGDNPLIGKNDESVGPRFPDMTYAYPAEIRELLKSKLNENSIIFEETILAGSEDAEFEYEEIEFLKSLNCRISNFNIPWISIVANYAGLEVCALAVSDGSESLYDLISKFDI